MKPRHPVELKKSVVKRRCEGVSLKDLVYEFKLPKSTIQGWISAVQLSSSAEERIFIRAREQGTKSRSYRRIALPSRIYSPPLSPDMVSFMAHCVFDGSIFHDRVIYYSGHLGLAKNFASIGQRLFDLNPRWTLTEEKVYRVHFFSKNLVDFLAVRTRQLLKNIVRMGLPHRIQFLRAFFDDEGSVAFRLETGKRTIRGFQKDREILELIVKLLEQIGIESKLENLSHAPEITISGQKNIEKFAETINFSPYAVFRATRKNSYYAQPVKKRVILQRLLASYR